MFTESEENQILSKGITIEEVNKQIERFRNGIPPIRLSKAAKIDNGITKLTTEEKAQFLSVYDQYVGNVAKFVPASGAASRMFKHLFEFKSTYSGTDEDYAKLVSEKGLIWDFFKRLEDFGFYVDLKDMHEKRTGNSLEEDHVKKEYNEILDSLLNADGLNYGALPKGLVKFHKYEEGNRTASHEQLVEGLSYAVNSGKLLIHFTVSPEHLSMFEDHLNKINEQLNDVEVEITYSIQKPGTDTIAVGEDLQPFKDDLGKILFRPAGHGALLENLDSIDADIVFIKNIDNVVPDKIKNETIKYKKLLAGVLIHFQSQIFEILQKNEKGADIKEEAHSLLAKLGIKGSFDHKEVIQKLNRPIRVCGMVENVGEPGGGPFWVENQGTHSLQIVESAQVNHLDENQENIFKQSTHFNPVDIVCGLKNFKGEPFNLLDFRDENTGFITKKSSEGRTLKAMELPGLWNGSMSDWNTIFVEVPLITFNPVKTVNDLLRSTHQ